MKLSRSNFRSDGIFGRLYNDNGVPIAFTLEHAYEQPDATFKPKLEIGTYKCVRGTHKLHNLIEFETFEITGSEGHIGILFHAGNYNKDSEGCVLLGHAILKQGNGEEMITSSQVTFQEFMQNLEGVNEFTLTIE